MEREMNRNYTLLKNKWYNYTKINIKYIIEAIR